MRVTLDAEKEPPIISETKPLVMLMDSFKLLSGKVYGQEKNPLWPHVPSKATSGCSYDNDVCEDVRYIETLKENGGVGVDINKRYGVKKLAF